jgi:glycerol-1-phosphate dehydrogenase [NAD(P)+]
MDVWPLPRISFRELSSIKEQRPTALITSQQANAAVARKLNLPLVIQAEPNRNDIEFFEYLAANLPSPVQVIYAVGQGQAIDAAKVVAQRNNKPLVIVPTAISSDSPFTATATVQDNYQFTEIVAKPADELIVDMTVTRQMLAHARAAAIAEVLAIVTALRDWSYAEQKGKTTPETKLVQWATGIGASLAAQAIKIAPAMGRGDPEALRTLIDLISMMVQLDSQLGHRRASQGVEHIFAHAVKAEDNVTHAERVGPGILIASALYNKDVVSMRTALESAGVRMDRLERAEIRGAVNSLPDYAREHNAPYSILNDLKSNSDELAQALTKSTLLG